MRFLRLTVSGWLCQSQDNKRFAGHRADVVMQAHQLTPVAARRSGVCTSPSSRVC
jgi:hypothetical protein